MPRVPATPRPAPDPGALDAGALHQAALAYLARFAATEAGLALVLSRRVDRWAREAAGDPEAMARAVSLARAAIPAIVGRLAGAGAVSDASFAQSRARSLARAGRSRRAIGARLAQKGVPGELAAGVLPVDGEAELAAALIHIRKRRLGPWRRNPATPQTARRELASLARAGFDRATAHRALGIAIEEAEARIASFRTG